MAPVIQGVQPLGARNGSVALTTNTDPGVVCQRLVLNATGASTVTITTLDGTTVSLGVLPVGVYQFDVQFTKVTFTAGTAVGFFRV